jgi:hypothetical protein
MTTRMFSFRLGIRAPSSATGYATQSIFVA